MLQANFAPIPGSHPHEVWSSCSCCDNCAACWPTQSLLKYTPRVPVPKLNPTKNPYHNPTLRQEAPLVAELVLATLLETARPGDAGAATVARNAAGRLDTPGGGHIPGDTPWAHPEAGEAGRASQGLHLSQEEYDGG